MAQKPETDKWLYVPAKWQTLIPAMREVRLIVIHSMESPEKGDTAENVGLFFKRGESRASAHVGVDNNSVVQYVYDNNVAWAAPGVNHDGIQIELAGFGRQSAKDWQDSFSSQMLLRAADVVAQYAIKYDIPLRHLTNKELTSGHAGIIGHYQATACYRPNHGHTDPGPNFPWDHFLELAEMFLRARLNQRSVTATEL